MGSTTQETSRCDFADGTGLPPHGSAADLHSEGQRGRNLSALPSRYPVDRTSHATRAFVLGAGAAVGEGPERSREYPGSSLAL